MIPDSGSRDLRRGVDRLSIIAFGLGTAVGVSVFSAIGPAYALAGPALLVSVVAALVPMLFVSIAYAFLGRISPISGASYEWPRRYLHPLAGFAVAWLRIIGNTGAIVVLALVLTKYVGMVVPVPVKSTMAAQFTLVLALNVFGIDIAATAQKILMALLLVVLAIFCVWGTASGQGEWTRLVPVGRDWARMLAATPLLIGLFFGIEAATEIGEEVRDNRRDLAQGIFLSIICAAVTYLAIAGVTIALLGDKLATSQAPLLDAAQRFMGGAATPVIVVTAILAIGKSMNAIFLMFSRGLFAMARAGMMPKALATVHPRWRTPWVACLVVYACAMAGLWLPTQLTFLFLAVSAPTLFKYGCVCLSAARLMREQPELVDRENFGLAPGLLRVAPWIGAVAVIVIFVVGIGTDWRPYALLAAWGVIGILWYAVARRSNLP